MGKKLGSKRKRAEAQEDIVEDLDLDVDSYYQDQADEDVIHNRDKKKKKRSTNEDSDDEMYTHVLPSDAHKLDEYEGGFLEEEDLALTTEKSIRRKAAEEDFDIAGLSVAKVKPIQSKKKEDPNPIIEAVERDFASLSKSERIAILKKESPEVFKMMEELNTYLEEIKALAKPLHELLYERKITSESDKHLVAFLETKVQLMLSYCMHVVFYLLLKSEGKKVAGHPVIDSLVEIRVYLEKMWPLEEKLQYSINRLISGKTSSSTAVSELRPVKGSESGLYESARSSQNEESRQRRRLLAQQREAEELDKEEESAMVRVQSKKASALNKVSQDTKFAPLSYNEDADQYLTKITGGSDSDNEDEGLSLTEVLKQRRAKMESLQASKSAKKKEDMEVYDDLDEEEEFEDDEFSGGDEEDDFDAGDGEEAEEDAEEDYDALWEEENARREEEELVSKSAPRAAMKQVELDRRKASKKIESHRGLTKSRPKDRKNPRVAQRRKYERGLLKHKAQTGKGHEPEPEGGFVGVRSLKTGIIKSNRLI